MAQQTYVFDKDAYVDDSTPDTNYGSHPGLYVSIDVSGAKMGTKQVSYASVDFSALGLAAGEVDTAYVKMYCYGCDAQNDEFQNYWKRATTSWVENTITWNNKPAISTPHSSIVIPVSIGWKTWTVTDMVTDAITSRSSLWDAKLDYGFYNAGVLNYAYYHSTEQVLQDKLPYLEINYTPAAAGASRNRGYVLGSRLSLPSLPEGWLRRRGLLVPA